MTTLIAGHLGDRDCCYYHRNGVEPKDLLGNFALAGWYDPAAVEAMRAELDAAGKDPSLAPTILRRQESAVQPAAPHCVRCSGPAEVFDVDAGPWCGDLCRELDRELVW